MAIAGALPRVVTSRDDVLAVLPGEYLKALSAPVRDALADSLYALLDRCQEASDYAAAQADPNRAVGAEENGLFEDRGVPRAPGEGDEDYRARAFTNPPISVFSSVRDAVNAILAPFTTATCAISDAALDRWFVGTGARSWHSYIGRTPGYPERLYAPIVPGNDPGGARVFDDTIGRQFLLRIPDLTGLVSAKVTPLTTTGPVTHRTGFYVGRRAYISGGQFSTTIYRAIVSTVNALVGHSVRWIMFADPKLSV